MKLYIKHMVIAFFLFAIFTIAFGEDVPPEALRHFTDGIIAEMNGDFDRALGSYLIAETIAPDNPEIIRTIGELYDNYGEPEKALARFARLVELDPKNESYRLSLAQAALRARKIVLAYDNLRWIMKNGHPDYAVRLKYITTMLVMHKEKDALKELEKLEKDFPNRPEPPALAANIYMSKHDYEKAIDGFEQAIAIDSSYNRALLGLVAAFDGLGETDSSINTQKRYIELNPWDDISQKRLIERLIEANRSEEAYYVAQKYIESFPKDWNMVRQVAFLAFSIEKYEGAIGYFGDYLAENPDDNEARLFYGRALSEAGMPLESIAQYKKILSKDRTPAVLIDLALAYADIDSSQRAMEILQKATEEFPDDPSTIFYRGVVYSRKRDYENAAATYSRFLDLRPDDAQAMFGLGDALQQLGNTDSAIVIFKKLTSMTPGDALGANYLAYLLIDSDRELDLADSLLEVALKADPDNAAYIDSYGWLLYRRGQFKKALEKLLRAEALSDPDDPVILEHIGIVHEKMGNVEAAKSYFQRALEIDPAMESSRTRLKELAK